MSKYFSLDKEQGAARSTVQTLVLYITVAFVIVSLVSVIRAINYYGGEDPVYGRKCATEKSYYTITGTNKTIGYETRSLAGACIRYLYSKGITEMGEITYAGYGGERRGSVFLESVDVSIDTTWGIHNFAITDFNGVKGRDTVINLIFIGGFERPYVDGPLTEQYTMEETKNTREF